jgi:hypothetical protein
MDWILLGTETDRGEEDVRGNESERARERERERERGVCVVSCIVPLRPFLRVKASLDGSVLCWESIASQPIGFST